MKNTLNRRRWLKQSLTASAGLLSAPAFTIKATSLNINLGAKPTAIVSGAGVMGSWTAYFLAKAGYEVTLCDPWGAGNPRASSGGESRLIRYMYGENEIYFNLARRAMELWKQEEQNVGKQLFFQNGMLIFSEISRYEYAEISRPFYEKAGLQLQTIPANLLKSQYPYLNTADLDHAIYDPEAGYLLAAESCQAVSQAVTREGGKFIHAAAQPGKFSGGKMEQMLLNDGTRLEADVFVFANGPWLGRSFPELLEGKLRVTRQPVLFFGPPTDFAQKLNKPFPVWMNRDAANQERCYGVYDPRLNAFKLAYTQLETKVLDPTKDERVVWPKEVSHARYLMEKRFAFMKDAPLIYTKVCQHTDTPDKNFILDQHPEANNLWLLGGGSGHAFKHGPALGELAVRSIVAGTATTDDFSISRLASLENFISIHK